MRLSLGLFRICGEIMNGIFTKQSLKENQAEFCVLSDVHIACGKRNDYVFSDSLEPLSCEAYMLKQLCERIKISGESGQFYDGKHTLILLGDIVNGCECGYFDCYNSPAFKLLHSSLEPWLYTGNILYFAGNHDKSAKFYSSVCKFPRSTVIETIEESSRKDKLFTKCGIIFEHGNKFDCLCTGKNLLGLMGDFASNVVVNLCSPDLEDLLRGRSYYVAHSLDNEIKTIPKDTKIKSMNTECRRVANGALKLLSKNSNNCHTIVCGHTHQSAVHVKVKDDNKELHYYNSGKFARDAWINLVVEQDKNNSWHLVE